MKKEIFIVIVVLFIIIGGIYWATRGETTVTPVPVVSESPAGQTVATTSPTYTLAQVAAHATSSDCWVAVENKVYGVTDFIPNHPGGPAIIQGCGKDATAIFNNRPGSGTPHPETARQALKNFYLGDLVQ